MVDWKKRLDREKFFFKEIITGNRCKNVLDLGCGVGDHLIEFSEWFKEGLGLDFSETSINIAKDRVKKKGLENKIGFICEDMRNLNNLDKKKKFDLIFCIGNSFALFSKQERDAILEQTYQKLNLGGIAVFQMVNYMKKSELSEWLINPKVFRNETGLLNFFVRILEWKDEKKEEVMMYVHELVQKKKFEGEFNHNQHTASFYVVRKKDFQFFENSHNVDISYFADYENHEFDVYNSNDLILVIKKNKERNSKNKIKII
ncbi:MAG: class I SAM-dependent methyltransferase [Candidatus Heimdallarchaeaceae archaeon]